MEHMIADFIWQVLVKYSESACSVCTGYAFFETLVILTVLNGSHPKKIPAVAFTNATKYFSTHK